MKKKMPVAWFMLLTGSCTFEKKSPYDSGKEWAIGECHFKQTLTNIRST